MKSMSELKYHFGLKMQAYPTKKQRQIINLNINVQRRVYNCLVALDREIYDIKHVKGVYIKNNMQRLSDLEKQRKQQRYLANAHPWLYNKKIDSIAVAHAKRNYQTAWKNYRTVPNTKMPHFKKWGYDGSYQTSAIYNKDQMTPFVATVRFIDLKTIRLPKVGKVAICGSQERILKNKTDIKIGTTTVKRDNCGDYYIALQLGSDTPFVKELPPADPANAEVGIDLNTRNFLETSDGIKIDNPHFLLKSIKRLRKEMRVLSRRQLIAQKQHKPLREAKNYQKQRLVVAKIYRHLTNQRKDFINKTAAYLTQKYGMVAAENLKSNQMLGKSHKLNQAIYEVSWYAFLQRMTTNAELYNRQFIKVDPANTTQMCSNCGHVMGKAGTKKLHFGKDNPRKIWVCPKCGTKHESDWNAAINILARAKLILEDDEATA